MVGARRPALHRAADGPSEARRPRGPDTALPRTWNAAMNLQRNLLVRLLRARPRLFIAAALAIAVGIVPPNRSPASRLRAG